MLHCQLLSAGLGCFTACGVIAARKLRELQQNVIQREHIRRLRAPSGQPQKTGGGGRVEDRLLSPVIAREALSYCQARLHFKGASCP